MNNSKKDHNQEPNSSVKSPDQKCQAGTLFHYFQKKVDPAKPPPPKGECDEVIKNNVVNAAEGSEVQNNDKNASPKQLKNIQHASCESYQHQTMQDQDQAHSQKNKHNQSEKELVDLTCKSDSVNGASKEANHVKKAKGSCEIKSNMAHSTKRPSQNPFQILMESGKKKGVWDKPTTKAKETENRSSEDECLEVESEVPIRSTMQLANVKHFSIFSKKNNMSAANTTLSNDLTAKSPDTPSRGGIRGETSTENGELEKLANESQSSSLRKSKSGKGLHISSSDARKSSKRKTSSRTVEDSTKETKSKKIKDSLVDKEGECFSVVSKIDRSKSSGEDVIEANTASTPRKSRLKVVSDSDFEPDNVQSGKRKGRTPSKSHNSNSKRPRTGSVARGDADASSKPAALSAAQKLVKKSRHQKRRRSSGGSRRDSLPSDKSGTKQTKLTAGRKDDNAQPVSADDQSDTGSLGGRSGRAGSKQKRRHPPSDSELEFTPGRKTKGRQKEAKDAKAGHTPGRKSERKRSRVGQTAGVSGRELDATPVKKPAKRASACGPRRHSSGTDVEVLSTKKCDRRSADVVELSPEKRPEKRPERRSARPRRPVILSDSEAEPSPVKRPARRPRAARPATPTDSELETTPAKKPPRRSSRPARPVRRLSDSEVELSPLKKRTPRGGGRRSAAVTAAAKTDEPEVVLVRSRSAGAAGARSGRAGMDAFQVMRRGGRPAKQTAAEKAASEARRAFLTSGVPESLQVQAEVARRLEESLTPLFPEVSHVHQRGGEEAPLPGAGPLPAGLSWRAESPRPPPPCPATVSGLVPGLVGRPGKPAQSAAVAAGGDTCSGELSSSAADPAVSPAELIASPAAAADASARPPRLPCLSPADCAASLRHLLSAERDAAASAAAGPALWTERFRPRRHEAFVGGALPAAELQEWLADWSAPTAGRDWADDDGSDEPASDATVLLLGPTGCGKTSAVYAAAAQLGFQVLEVSASSRRSGRHLSSQLSEATQSQRVSLTGGGGGVSAADPPSRSLLLLEDVQLTSDELDDGFLAAAASLAAAAKRPVVLTSGDPAVTRTRLLRALPHRLLTAVAPPAAALRSQLTLVALTRGWLLPDAAATRLAQGGDVRRALLQLQWLCEGAGDSAEKVDTRRALTEAQLETTEEFVEQLPAQLKVVRLRDERPEPAAADELQTECVGRRQSGWQPPVREAAAGYDGQTRRRWRCVDPDLFSDEDEARPAPSPTSAPAAEPAPGGSQPERPPPEERALLSASVAALAGLYDLRSACDALVAPAERDVMGGWWQRRPQADMAETEQPRCVTEERAERLGRQLAGEALRAAGRSCTAHLRTARSEFSVCGRAEPAGLSLPLYDEEGVREAAWEESGRLAPAVPSLLLSRRAATADLLPSIRRICRLECGRRATDGGRTRRFLHYFDQMGLHAVPSGLRTHICKSLM